MPTNAQYRELIDEMAEVFHRFKQEAILEEHGMPAASPPPKRVWECPGHDPHCGLWFADKSRGKYGHWHPACWAAYQIKKLRRMVGDLRSHKCNFRSPDTFIAWAALCDDINDQLAELYPKQKDTP